MPGRMRIGRCASLVLLAGAGTLLAQPPNRLGAELQVNSYTVYAQTNAAVASDALGDFVVVWADHGQEGEPFLAVGVRAQRFNPAGVKLGVEFQVNTYTLDIQ